MIDWLDALLHTVQIIPAFALIVMRSYSVYVRLVLLIWQGRYGLRAAQRWASPAPLAGV